MKVKVNIINTFCILMSEAVPMPRLTMTTSMVSESIARDTQLDTHTDFCFVCLILKTIIVVHIYTQDNANDLG